MLRSRLIIYFAFVVTCVGFFPLALYLADPLTHRSVGPTKRWGPFHVVVVRGDQAWVEKLEDPHHAPPPPPGASYLVPPDQSQSVVQRLRDQDTHHRDSSWVLRTEDLSADRQRIELFLLGDGFSGGVYEATPTTVTPLYRKSTGPGFAFIVAPLALLLNTLAWAGVRRAVTSFRRRRRS